MDLHGQVVDVYRNLHRKCWSVRHRGRVQSHCETVTLGDVTFRVSEAGRQRVLRERRKNVHAVVRGTLVAYGGVVGECTLEVTYNPYESGTFRYALTGMPVLTAKVAYLHNGKVWVSAGHPGEEPPCPGQLRVGFRHGPLAKFSPDPCPHRPRSIQEASQMGPCLFMGGISRAGLSGLRGDGDPWDHPGRHGRPLG